MLQATNLFASAVNDRYRSFGVPVVLVLGVVHLAFAGWVLYHRGPLTRGRAWTAAWIAMIFVVQMGLAHLLAQGDFAAYGVGVPMGNYALIPLAVFAFYPWGGLRDARRRRVTEGGLILAIVLHPLLIVGLMHRWDLAGEHVRSVVQYGVWALVWFLVGKGIAWLCRIAVKVETEAQSESYETALGDLHTHVDNAAKEIEAGHDPREVALRLRELTSTRRRQLLMGKEENVGAVDIFNNAVRAHGDRLPLRSSPYLGGLGDVDRRALRVEHRVEQVTEVRCVHTQLPAHGDGGETALVALDHGAIRDPALNLAELERTRVVDGQVSEPFGQRVDRLPVRGRQLVDDLVPLECVHGATVAFGQPSLNDPFPLNGNSRYASSSSR